MMLLCPICRKRLMLDTSRCVSGHVFPQRDGVINLLSDALQARIAAIEHHRDTVRQALPLITDYTRLPCTLARQHFEWRMRCQDLSIVQHHLAEGKLGRVLEVGAWNGWLTHHLARMSHEVLAVDYFSHPDDGLGAKRHYPEDWHAIQMDISDLTLLPSDNDAVIINHGLHLLPNPLATIRQAQKLLAPGGLLLVLNITFYRAPSRRIAHIAALSSNFQAQHGTAMFLHPTRGYMDLYDRDELRAAGLRLCRYRARWRAMLKSWLHSSAPIYAYGLYTR